ncbi:MAG TPA: nitronate monooxygenase [Candidatus Competibacteraceae bacterium]|nr:nitronate monooxygenase [Candidatus Competibacteraceae bacterium]
MSSAFLQTALTELLGCRYPILQAGMGGVARADLVTAVGTHGGYGFLGMVRERPERIADQIARVRCQTDRPFGVNLIPAGTDPVLLEEELAVCFEAQVHSLCFFWEVRPDLIQRARAAGCRVLYQIGSVEEAVAAADAGAQAVIAQGFEAGGHVRGTVTSLVLLPEVVAAVNVPVVASGGFASGASLVAALALGAHGIHCGTAFLATAESFAHDVHKQKLVSARATDTVYTDVFAINWPPRSPVRVIANAITAQFQTQLLGHGPEAFEREVIAWDAGRPIYKFSTDSPLKTTTGDLESLPAFAGQVAGSLEEIPTAGQRLERMVREAEATLERLRTLACGDPATP